ncbi:hypothetical protein EYC80_006584 [Monilinia laxa]|uniref:Uncharacterized protein n=1 Tax=Monilinia laxa TaxID=61186 RepID=A0A5N6JV32_MONLA|nr:hypothetical protein EYC80_006584 [Monilinia laxa]
MFRIWEGRMGGNLTLLHLGDQFLVEETTGLLVKRTVDSNNITLRQHLLQVRNSSTSDLLLNLRLKRLVIKVQQLLAVKRLQSSQDTLTDSTHCNGTDDLALEIKLVLGGGCNVPLASLDLLVCGYKVADQNQDGHDDVLGDRYDVGSGYLGNGDTAVSLIGSVEIDVVGSNTGCDGDLEVLGLGETLGCEVAWVETRMAEC